MSLRKTPHVLCGALRVCGCSWSLGIFRSMQARPKTACLPFAVHAIPALDCPRKTPKGRRPWMGAVFSRAAPRPRPLAWISDAPPRAGIHAWSDRKGCFLLVTFLCSPSKKSNSPKAKAFQNQTSPDQCPSARRRAGDQCERVQSRRGYFSVQPFKEK
jgi:hypothetical protein